MIIHLKVVPYSDAERLELCNAQVVANITVIFISKIIVIR